jgi:hypothetical protein
MQIMYNSNTMAATSQGKLHAANGDANQITTSFSLCAIVNTGLNHKQATFRNNIIYCPDISTSSSMLLAAMQMDRIRLLLASWLFKREGKKVVLKYIVYKR